MKGPRQRDIWKTFSDGTWRETVGLLLWLLYEEAKCVMRQCFPRECNNQTTPSFQLLLWLFSARL